MDYKHLATQHSPLMLLRTATADLPDELTTTNSAHISNKLSNSEAEVPTHQHSIHHQSYSLHDQKAKEVSGPSFREAITSNSAEAYIYENIVAYLGKTSQWQRFRLILAYFLVHV